MSRRKESRSARQLSSVAALVLALSAATAHAAGLCPANVGHDSALSAAHLAAWRDPAAAIEARPGLDANDDGTLDDVERRLSVDAIFADCGRDDAAVEEALAVLVGADRFGQALLAALQVINATEADAGRTNCPIGGTQARMCEALDAGFVRQPFAFDRCTYVGDDGFAASDGLLALTGIGSCPGLFQPSGARIDFDVEVSTGTGPGRTRMGALDLTGTVDRFDFGAGPCTLEGIEMRLAGEITGTDVDGTPFRVEAEAVRATATFSGRVCVPQAIELEFDGGLQVVRGQQTRALAAQGLAVAVDVSTRQATEATIEGVAGRWSAMTDESLELSETGLIDGAVTLTNGARRFQARVAADGTVRVDEGGDGYVDRVHASDVR